MLNQIKTLLNIEVILEEQKLENGTIVEAESFEKGKEIFIKTDDEKVAMPVGEYLLQDGRLVVVAEEGIIGDVREVSDEVPQKEAEDGEEITEDLEEDKEEEKMSYVSRQELEEAVEEVKEMIEEVKARLEEKKEEMNEDGKGLKSRTVKEEFSEAAAKPIKHNPEGKKINKRVFAKSKTRTTLDRVLNKLNK